jgi:hypothetical protein
LPINLDNLELVARAQGKAVAHDDGLNVVIEQHADQRVLEARHHHGLVNEGVFVAAHVAQAEAQLVLVVGAHVVDDDDLEVGPRVQMLVLGLERLLLFVVRFSQEPYGNGSAPIGIAHQRPHDARHGVAEADEVALVQKLA